MKGFKTLSPRQYGRHFPGDILKCIFLNENIRISIKISMKFVAKGPINNIPPLVQIMAWRRPGDKPLSELMMVSLLTHICGTRPQWVKHTRSMTQSTACPINLSTYSILDYGVDIHYNDVIVTAMASQITSLTIVYSAVYSGADDRKH